MFCFLISAKSRLPGERHPHRADCRDPDSAAGWATAGGGQLFTGAGQFVWTSQLVRTSQFAVAEQGVASCGGQTLATGAAGGQTSDVGCGAGTTGKVTGGHGTDSVLGASITRAGSGATTVGAGAVIVGVSVIQVWQGATLLVVTKSTQLVQPLFP